MATTTAAPTVSSMLASAPRVAAALELPGVYYAGPCVVQGPGAWTRVGPTWRVPEFGWVTVGPGARQWGTTEGLAELASQSTAKPVWHAIGISVIPVPNLVFVMTAEALRSSAMSMVLALAREADEVSS